MKTYGRRATDKLNRRWTPDDEAWLAHSVGTQLEWERRRLADLDRRRARRLTLVNYALVAALLLAVGLVTLAGMR